jgi:hypothetical protein
MSKDRCDRCGNGIMYHAMGGDHDYVNSEEHSDELSYYLRQLDAVKTQLAERDAQCAAAREEAALHNREATRFQEQLQREYEANKKLEAQCAAMREALEPFLSLRYSTHPGKPGDGERVDSAQAIVKAREALTVDAGTALLNELRALRENIVALSRARDHWKREADRPRNETDDGWRPGDG